MFTKLKWTLVEATGQSSPYKDPYNYFTLISFNRKGVV